MEEEMVSLRWNNHLTILSQLLYTLREEELLIDVTLACDGKLFTAHKFVLSMCSDYFKEMFISNPCKHPIVFMKDVRSEDMEALLDFVYHGIVHIPQDNLSSLLKTAEGLQIRGLGVFAREAAASNTESHNSTPAERERTTMNAVNAPSDPNSIMSPAERKRTAYEMEHDQSAIVGFSDGDLDDSGPLHLVSGSSVSNAGVPLQHRKKVNRSNSVQEHPPARIPDLPKVGEDMLDMGGGVSIAASDYYRFRRTNTNRYINDLLRYFFPLEVLASSSLTGGECFANKERGPSNKNQLDPVLIRVLTHDAIRNFPTITEKQVRNAIRRKLNTESRIYRGLIRPGNPSRRSTNRPRKPRFTVSPRAQVSIEKSDRENKKGPLGMGSMATPNVTVEKAVPKDVRRASYASPSGAHSQVSHLDMDKDDEVSYFRTKAPTPTQYPQDQQTPPQHSVTASNSATPTPISTPNLPPSTGSSPQTSNDKSFSLVKSELPSSAQYIPQEYSYAGVMPSHVTQAYLPHHPISASDSAYLRRLEANQSGGHASLATFYHSSLPASESLEHNLHM